MSDRGRHSRRSGVGFYKDVLFLIAGILIVGALVFGGLSLWAGRDNGDPPTTPTTGSSTTQEPTPSTDAPATSPTPATTSTPPATSAPATTPSTTPPTTLRAARSPSEVRVVVLNSTTTVGVAGELSDELGALGYQMSEAANYTPELSDSMVFHADGFSLEALELVEAVPDATVAADPALAEAQGVDIVVVIGLSYQG